MVAKVKLVEMHNRETFLGIVQDKEVAVMPAQSQCDMVRERENQEREGVSSWKQMCALENDRRFWGDPVRGESELSRMNSGSEGNKADGPAANFAAEMKGIVF